MLTENQVRTSNTKISEALELLNEAAREKKDELKVLLTDKYSYIKQLAQNTVEEGGEKIQAAMSEADKRVRKNPWPYLAGTAAASLLLGYLLGNKRN